MKLGVFSQALDAGSAAEAATKIRELGLQGINIHRQLPDDLLSTLPSAERCRQVRDAYLAAGLEIVGFAGYRNLIHPDAAEREAGLRLMEHWIRHARDLGTTLVATETGTLDPRPWSWHPDNASPATWDRLLDALRRLTGIAAEHGVTVGVEPFSGNVVNSAARARAMLDQVASPALGIVFDPANLLGPENADRRDEVIAAGLRLLAPEIVLAHAKDYAPPKTAGDRPTLPAAGQGIIDFARYLRGLQEVGYRGHVILEHLKEPEIPAARDLILRRMPA
jgi:sugar phosphate isomerase/epimerase